MPSKTKDKKKRDWPIIALVSVVAIVSALIFVFGPGLLRGGPEFTVIIHYQYHMDPGVVSGDPGPGNVTVTGDITNIGNEGGTPIVHITVFTGFASEVFTIEASPCVAGAHVTFEWVHHFDRFDPDIMEIECDVEALQS